MSLPKDGGLDTTPPAVAALTPSQEPCPAGVDVPREGSREIQKRGKVISVPHDWCKSTDSPVPYKIWCWQADAGNLANSVRQTDCRSHVQGSYVKVCYGDEPGKGGGIKSGTCQAECTLIGGSPTVRAEGRPMGRRFDKWHMNHGNTWGCRENPEDTGNYDAPKAKLIERQLQSTSRENEKKSSLPPDASKYEALVGADDAAVATVALGPLIIEKASEPRLDADPQPEHGPPPPIPLPPGLRVSGDCVLIPSKNNKCVPGFQKHHVVANRSFAQAHLSDVLSRDDGLTICLKGQAFPRTLLTGHAVAQKGYDLTTIQAAAPTHDGMLPLVKAEEIGAEASVEGAKADGRKCSKESFQAQLRTYHQAHGLSPQTRVYP